MRLILASSSKNRQDIFKMMGWKYEVIKSLVEEKSDATTPEQYVKDLSRDKVNSVASQVKDKAVIVAADEVIYMDGKIFEKPKSKEEAFQNIKEMYQSKEISFSDTAEVYIKEVNDEEIKWYVENEETVLKRCGYAMLGKAALFLDKVNGDYNTLFGISPSKVYEKFKQLGYTISDFELEK